MDKKIACIYMTHNNSEDISVVLSNICDSYRDKGIDVIYYDSSDDDSVEKLVEQYNLKGYSNIYYVDMKFTKGPDEKFIYMLKNYEFPRHYDYIWNSKDRVFLRGQTLDRIVESIQEGHDIVFAVCEIDRWEVRMPPVKDVYTDPVEFFSHYGQLTTNWECLIRKTETMIDPVDWDEAMDKYNLAYDKSFNQSLSLFSRLAELENCSIKIVRTDYNEKIYVSLKPSGWQNSVFDLWIDQWVKAIYSLPAIYDPYKIKIIKAETGIPSLFGSVDGMIIHKNNGLLTKEIFDKYRPTWNIVTDFPEKFVDLILDENYSKLMATVIVLFDESFKKENYDMSYHIFATNGWLKGYYEESVYQDMSSCFYFYKTEIDNYGSSSLFEGVHSPDELIEKYRTVKSFINTNTLSEQKAEESNDESAVYGHKKIAWCIPTYNRAIVIDETLRNIAPLLNKYGIDLYVYDSSSNNETESISKKYESYDNFKYIKLPPETRPIEKTKLIFTGFQQTKGYDYIWLVKDKVYVVEELIKRIIKDAENEPDAIFLRAIETEHTMEITRECYDDPVSLYHDWGWAITSWDLLLLSHKNILDMVNWDEILEKYVAKNELDFILVVLLFDTLAKKEKCRVPVIEATAGTYLFNVIFSNKPSEDITLDVWGYKWHHINSNLPDIYDDEKEFVIKSATSRIWILGNHIRLMQIWHDGGLTDEKLSCVKDIWDKISDIPWQDVCEIKNGNRACIEKFYVDTVWNLIESNCMNYMKYSYNNTLWIKDNITTKDLQYTIYAIEIYLVEENNNDIHIFDGGYDKKLTFMKIDLIINALYEIENGNEIQSNAIKEVINNNLISITMVAYLAKKCCDDFKGTFNKFIDLIS